MQLVGSCWSYLCGLLEGLLVDCNQDDGMRSLAILGRLLDLLDHVLAFGEVDECSGAHLLQTHLLLVVSSVDGDHSQTHGFGVLLSKSTKSATGSNNGDSLSWAGVGLLQALVDCDTGTEHGRDCVERDFLVEASDVGGFGDAVLLEGSVDSVT